MQVAPPPVTVTVALPLPVAVGPVNAFSVVLAEFDAADGGPTPAAFVAVTVNVYDEPFVSPVTVSGDAAPVAVMPPGLEVAV